MFHAEGREEDFSKHREMLPGTSEATHSVCCSWKNSSVQVGRERSGELVRGRVGKGLAQQVKDFRGQQEVTETFGAGDWYHLNCISERFLRPWLSERI